MNDRITIGKGEECDIRLEDEKRLISSYHAQFVRIEQGYAIEDLRSSNGVAVNGKIIFDRVPLQSGDRVHIGDIILIYGSSVFQEFYYPDRATEQAAAEQVAKEQAEAERKAKEEAKAQARASEQAEREREAREQAEAKRLAAEQVEKKRKAREQVEAKRLAAEQVEKKRKARERAEAKRLVAEKAEEERLAKEQAEAQRKAQEQAEVERVAKDTKTFVRRTIAVMVLSYTEAILMGAIALYFLYLKIYGEETLRDLSVSGALLSVVLLVVGIAVLILEDNIRSRISVLILDPNKAEPSVFSSIGWLGILHLPMFFIIVIFAEAVNSNPENFAGIVFGITLLYLFVVLFQIYTLHGEE